MATRVHIRWMIRRDMAEVLDIENLCFDDPWREDDFVRCLRARNCIGYIAEMGCRVVAFMIYEMHKKRLHLLNLAVHPDYWRQGIGSQMVATLTGKLVKQNRVQLDAETRETNLGAQLFFHSQGLRAVDVLRNYYEGTEEDAYLFRYRVKAEEPAKAAN